MGPTKTPPPLHVHGVDLLSVGIVHARDGGEQFCRPAAYGGREAPTPLRRCGL